MPTAFATFAAASVIVVLFPGPDTLVVLRNLLRGGRRAAARTAAGVLCGLSIWVAAAALGVSALLRTSQYASLALRVAGACYLLVLGIRSLRAREHPEAVVEDGIDPQAGRARRASLLGTGFTSGLATDLLNPKVGIFFVTFLPGFIPHGAPVGAWSLAFGGIFVLETAAYFAVMVLASETVVRLMGNRSIRRRIDRATGMALVGFAVRLAVER